MKVTYYKELLQHSPEWFALRNGIVTVSEINNLVTNKGKIKEGKAVETYANIKAAQRINGFADNFEGSSATDRGTMMEPIARDYYSENFEHVEECGFILLDHGKFKLGASPDGLVNENGGIEIKSRLGKFQIETQMKDEVPEEYMNQIQASLFVSGREYWDYVQYSNGMPLYVKRVYPDKDRFKVILTAVNEFELLVQEKVDKYNAQTENSVKTEFLDLFSDFSDCEFEA